MKQIIEYFQKSIDDMKMSGSEKKALNEILGESNINKQKLLLLHSEIFKIAGSRINGHENYQIVKWLEKASKIIIQNINPTGGEVYFSPGEDCVNAVISNIKKAKRKIDICLFTISDNKIAHAIKECFANGIKIRIITDDDKTGDMGSDIFHLNRVGVEIKIDWTRHHMHHKFATIDEKKVLTGSFNWTRSASEYNHENLLITENKSIVTAYQREFNKLWREMRDY